MVCLQTGKATWVLTGHLLIIIVGQAVPLCNYPFNYSDQYFHYPSSSAVQYRHIKNPRHRTGGTGDG
jgi:hypothetical protein